MKYEIDVIDTQTGYDGFFQLNRYRLRHSLFAGGWSKIIERERIERLRATGVLLYDPDRDQVVLVEQFRIGALEAGGEDAWLLEIAAGLMHEGELAEEVARKEVMEETGIECLDLYPICNLYVSPGTASERLQLYCGRVDASNAGGIYGLADEGEDIRVRVMMTDEALAELEQGRANSTAIVISLQWLALNRERIREHWS